MAHGFAIRLFLACLLAFAPAAAGAVELLDAAPVLSLDHQPLEAWLEPGDFTADQVAASAEPQLRSSSFHYRREPVWLRIPVWNRSSKADWHLYVHPRTLQSVELSLFLPELRLEQRASYRIGHAGEEGSLDTITPGFALRIPPGERRILVLRVQGYEQLGLDIRFELPEAGSKLARRLDLGLGIYMGVLTALLFYTALIYRTLREDFFRPYMLFMASMLLLVPTLNGGPDYLFDVPFRFTDWIALATALTCLGGNEFCREFLKLRVHSPRLNRVQAGLSVLCAFAALQSLPPVYHAFPGWVGAGNDAILLATALLIFIAGVVAVRAGVKSSHYFMLAWLGFLFSCVVFLFSTHGWIPNNVFTRSAVEIGNTLEMLILAVAISDRVRELELERLASLKRALHADRLQSLVKMICHDLTSPLSVVSAHAEMGKRGRPASWDAVTRAVEEQDRIVSFVRSHGELVESPVAGESMSPVSVVEVLATLRFLFEGRARAKSIELEVCVVVDGLRIWGEQATLIHSVLGNAVSNAIKFSNPGSVVQISLTESASASGDGWVELRVEDFGVGMPLALQQRILASRKGVHRPGTQGEPGTGYGLGLMRYFTESYGGTFSWNSRSAEDGFQQTGTTMVFRLRRVQATGLPHPAKSGTLGA